VVNVVLCVLSGATIFLGGFLRNPPHPGWKGINIFPKDVYYIDRIPSEVSYVFTAIIIVAAVVTSVLSSLYPAVKASQYDPIEAIRRE
jgi:ABC-type lipoprotein release transport system permease subunit